jgi:4-amino-4-deoxy-L-arabinose transferase-like glycosyltransferase
MNPEIRLSGGAITPPRQTGSGPGADGGRSLETTALLLIGGLTLLGLILRLWHLGAWNLQATEMFTYRDSQRPQFGNPRPLGYLLNYFVVRPFIPLDEFGLRLIPALAGTLAIPAIYVLGRRLVGSRAALFAALLVTLNPTQILYSQLARYWSLVFLFAIIAPIAIYLGVRERSGRMFALGVVATILAGLSHPVGALAVGGPALLLLAGVRREQLAEWSTRRAVRIGGVVVAALAALALYRFVPLLGGWISMHDRMPGYGQFLLRPQAPPGVKQLMRLLALTDSLTVPVVLAALAGVVLVWRAGRERHVALFLASVAGFHIAFLLLVSLRTSVSLYYFLPATPVFFLGAGLFLDRLCRVDWQARPTWLVPATVALMIVAAGIPTVISDYRDGRRFDFRGAARWLTQVMKPGDVVFSDQPMVLQHYLPQTKVLHLQENPTRLADSLRSVAGGRRSNVWVVAPAASHAFRATLKEGGLRGWIYTNCQLDNTLGWGRIDLRQEYLQVYRCPPAPAPGL